MKKLLLSSLIVVLSVSLFAQNHYTKSQNAVKVQNVEMTPDGFTMVNGNPVIGEKSLNEVSNVGVSYWDLQSYSNIMSRMWEYDDGTVGVTWMGAGEGIVDPNRGTGYNYYDGTEWGDPVPHIGEDERTGWPSYAPWGENGEVIEHYWYPGGEPGPIRIYTREIKGEGDWTMNTVYAPDDLSIVWASMMTSGDNHEFIHLLARTYDAPYMGQDNALLYYRSSDGGASWDIEGEVIEGLGVDYRPNSGNLVYNWANSVGSTIAFSYGFDEFGGQIFKSTDNGDNWDIIDAYLSPIDPFNIPADSGPIAGGDGNSAIVLDSQGKAHVVFGKKVILYQGGTTYWFPVTEGIIYWNEDMEPLDTAILSSYTNDFLIAGGNLIGWLLPDATGSYDIMTDQYYYGSKCMTSFPQLGIDENDDIFLTYTAIAPGFDDGTRNFRHIHMNASYDGGNSWTGPFDVTSDIAFWIVECVYPAISLNVKNGIHIMFQMDDLIGNHVWLDEHDEDENTFVHMDFPVNGFTGVNDFTKNQSFEVSQNYPNPAVNSTVVGINLQETSDVSLEIVNLTGQLVKSIDLGRTSAGVTNVTIDISDLSSGIYYYTVSANDEQITNKLIVR
jgi:hypothetical protein